MKFLEIVPETAYLLMELETDINAIKASEKHKQAFMKSLERHVDSRVLSKRSWYDMGRDEAAAVDASYRMDRRNGLANDTRSKRLGFTALLRITPEQRAGVAFDLSVTERRGPIDASGLQAVRESDGAELLVALRVTDGSFHAPSALGESARVSFHSKSSISDNFIFETTRQSRSATLQTHQVCTIIGDSGELWINSASPMLENAQAALQFTQAVDAANAAV